MGNRLAMSMERQDQYLSAVQQGNTEVVSCLFESYNVGVNDRYFFGGCWGRTALLIASMHGHHLMVKQLLENGAMVDMSDEEGSSALTKACLGGHIKVVRILLEEGAQVDFKDKKEWTALMNASQEGHYEVVKLLLEKGAQVDLQRKNGWTALLSACERNRYDVVDLLLDKGAQIDLQWKDGLSALLCASREEQTDMAKLLIAKGANVNLQMKDGCSSLMGASKSGNCEMVKVLLRNGAKVDLQNKDLWSPLMMATQYGHVEVVKVLLGHGANVLLQSMEDESAYSLALLNGSPEIIGLIEGKNTDTDGTVMLRSTLCKTVPPRLSLHALILIKWRDSQGHQKKFQLINKVSSRWRNLGRLFGKSENSLDGLEDECNRKASRCWCKIMSHWLAQKSTASDYPVSWEGLLIALEDIEYTEVAIELKEALSSFTVTVPSPPILPESSKDLTSLKSSHTEDVVISELPRHLTVSQLRSH